MPFDLYLAFIVATAVLILIPGPNVALIVANSIAHGPRCGLLTVAGTASAMVLQLALTVLGMSTLLALLADWLEWLRWLGVAYLLWLGVQAWRARAVGLADAKADPYVPRAIWLRGFLVSLTNPKTLLFDGAFLPQFIDASGAVERQLALLAATFVAIAVLLDGCWALLAGRLRGLLAIDGRLRNRITGTFLVGAGVGLALARKG